MTWLKASHEYDRGSYTRHKRTLPFLVKEVHDLREQFVDFALRCLAQRMEAWVRVYGDESTPNRLAEAGLRGFEKLECG